MRSTPEGILLRIKKALTEAKAFGLWIDMDRLLLGELQQTA